MAQNGHVNGINGGQVNIINGDHVNDINGGQVNGINGANESISPHAPDNVSVLSNWDFGMKPEVRKFWGRENCPGHFNWQNEAPSDVDDPAEIDESSKSAAIILQHLRKQGADPIQGACTTNYVLKSIIIQSPLLINVLGSVLDGYPDITPAPKCLQFWQPFRPLIHRWESLNRAIEWMQQIRDNDGDASWDGYIQHAKLLDKVLNDEFSELKEMIMKYKENKVISFEHLWTIFEPSTLVFTRYKNTEAALQVYCTDYCDRSQGSVFELTCVIVEFDGNGFGVRTVVGTIPAFSGTKPISSLPLFPLELHGQDEQIRARLIERGRKLESLTGIHYRNCQGLGWRCSRNDSKLSNWTVVNERVMVDAFGFHRYNPGDNIRLYSLGESSPQDLTKLPGLTQALANTNMLVGDCSQGFMPAVDYCNSEADQTRPSLTELQKLICSPYVWGFLLKGKKWLNLSVDDITDIDFDKSAFSDLILPRDQKDLIFSSASCKHSHRNYTDHLIEGEGRGVVVLLSGPPGVGKTFTAESVAEHAEVPLFTLAAGDPQFEPNIMEASKHMNESMCARWGAIIVIDEADVILGERSSLQLGRSKLVSAFSRVLEHYEGMMFLITNHGSAFDAALRSRIRISLHYAELDKNSRKSIWETCLRRHKAAQASAQKKLAPAVTGDTRGSENRQRTLSTAPAVPSSDADAGEGAEGTEELDCKLTQPHRISDEEIDKLADLKLNGHQIKNFLRFAQQLATFREEALDYTHIESVVSASHDFLKLEGES
ncbi:hypothetical protein diail_2632 [Diaporthe ilicicola]|nr:hypothetical protein diail_2632 [Diaporthe ilicicola]